MASSEDNQEFIDSQESNFGEPAPIHEQHDVAWDRKTLLSLDGGGIRGYWSLLVLKRLMKTIAEIEEGYLSSDGDSNHCSSSFDPCDYPDNVSQSTLSEKEEQRQQESSDHTSRRRVLSPAKRYLPCHYFDLICGSSTGALIAIMLGRLRMTVKDCLDEYKNLGDEVFGHPRSFSTRYWLFMDRPLYNGDRFKETLRKVISRRSEHITDVVNDTPLRSDRHLCRTAITALEVDSKVSKAVRMEGPYIFRSYQISPMARPSRVSTGFSNRSTGVSASSRRKTVLGPPRRTDTNQSVIDARGAQRTKEEQTCDVALWRAAKAATAADLYFPLVQIKVGHGVRCFRDGGFGEANNPSRVGFRELEDEFGESVSTIVSVGTARGEKPPENPLLKHIGNYLERWVDRMTDPEPVHQHMSRFCDRQGIKYFRLNADRELAPKARLSMNFDEWKPRKTFWRSGPSGAQTIKEIEESFREWLKKTESINRLRYCAQQLVDQRRERSLNESRWARFATGLRYECLCQESEGKATSWSDATQYKVHLRTYHNDDSSENEIERTVASHGVQWQYQSRPRDT